LVNDGLFEPDDERIDFALGSDDKVTHKTVLQFILDLKGIE
jgi:hypothetical protein